MLEVKAIKKKREASGKPAVVVKNVTKEFIIPHERKTTLFENLKGAFRPSTYEQFTALKDVSFAVERGESVGIIGDNGSGKSTLLKIIAKILRPTSGSIEVNGRITPFLELGVGFSQDLTARENIEVYSTIMGLTDKEISRNIDNVLEFAGLTKFRDTKLKNFSSGMQVRLAFATAIQREPDILLVDEVLAVGDMEFQEKCFDAFRQYKEKGVTLILVSHDLNSVRRFCDKALLLSEGSVVSFGSTNDIIDRYIYGPRIAAALPTSAVGGAGASPVAADGRQAEETDRWGNRAIEVTGVKLIDKYGNQGSRFYPGDPMTVSCSYKANGSFKEPVFGIVISDEKGNRCFGTNTVVKKISMDKIEDAGEFNFSIRQLPLLEGMYYVTIVVVSLDNSSVYDWHDKKYNFHVMNNTGDSGFILFDCDVSVTPDMKLEK